MAEFPAMPFWTDAYLADTTHLSTEEHGAYLLLLITAWRTRSCSLPDDDRMLAKYAKLSPRKWRAMRPVLEEFFEVSDGHWRQAKQTKIREKVSNYNEKQRINGKRGGRPKSLKNNKTGKANGFENENPNQNPKKANQYPVSNNPLDPPEKNKTETENSDQGGRNEAAGKPARGNLTKPKPSARITNLDDLVIDDDWRRWATAETPGIDIEREAGKFRDYCRSRDRRFRDYRAAFRNWLRKAEEFRLERLGSSLNGHGEGDERSLGGERITPARAKYREDYRAFVAGTRAKPNWDEYADLEGWER